MMDFQKINGLHKTKGDYDVANPLMIEFSIVKTTQFLFK